MDTSLYAIIGLLVGAGIGIIIGRFLLRKLFKAQENTAQNKAKLILKDAENNAEILNHNVIQKGGTIIILIVAGELFQIPSLLAAFTLKVYSPGLRLV